MKGSIHVGHISKSWGKEGSLRFSVKDIFHKDVANSKYLLIEIDGLLIPYFVEKFDWDKSLVKFESIKGPEMTFNLTDSRMFLLEKDVTATQQDMLLSDPQNELIGFMIHDQNDDHIGTIIEVLEMPMQVLFQVDTGKELKSIPFHEQLLLDFNPEDKIIRLEIASGLMDL